VIRDAIARWTHGEDWRTWVAHAVIALILTAALGPFFGWGVGVGYYLIREAEQVLYATVDRKPIDWFDNFMDVAVPAAVVLTAVGVYGLV
jgi:nitrogen fixation-related uncharacterized protein